MKYYKNIEPSDETVKVDEIADRFLKAYALDRMPDSISIALDHRHEPVIERSKLETDHRFPDNEDNWQELYEGIPDYIVYYMHIAVDAHGEARGEEEVVEFLVHLAKTWDAMDSVCYMVCEMPYEQDVAEF